MLAYEELTPCEREVWDAFPVGRQVDLRTGEAEADDPAAGDSWGPERTVRAAVLLALLLGGNGTRAGAVPALRLAGARITGRLDLAGAEIGDTLWLKHCLLEQGVVLYGAVARTVRITGCRVRGDMNAGLARFEGQLDLHGTVLLGRLSLLNAQVAGELSLNGTRIAGDGGWSLFAGGLHMGGAIFGKGLQADLGMRMPGAQLPGGLFLQSAEVGATGDVSLLLDNTTVSTVRCTEGFTARGTVRLRRAQIADLVSFEGAVLEGAETALVCTGMRAEDLDTTLASRPAGVVDLRSAQVAWYRDSERTWPEVLQLEGFVYGAARLENPDSAFRDDAARRLRWIARTPRYHPQPYEQLASNYRRIGHDEEARRVLLAKQRHRRRTLHPAGRAWGCLLDGTVGYGYRPWLAGVWLLALTLLGTVVFGTGHPTRTKPGEGAPFNAFVYTLDLLIPIGGLGQRDSWHWGGGAAQTLSYVLIGLGWMLTTALVAGVTRTLNRN
ncbi:oxidoreductase [Streptomyces albus subsp. albus]|nr:oxidoreductase [Streptomyces albus subsp. albus]